MAQHPHLDQITIDIPDWLDRHIRHHPARGGGALRHKRLLRLPVRHMLDSATDMVSLRCADTNDIAATDAVVASEITRLRIKARENRTNSISKYSQTLHACIFPRTGCVSWVTPTKLPAAD